MKYLLFFLFLIPLVSAINITVDYSNPSSSLENIKFDICLIDSTKTYDLKIDIFQNEKRVSKILNHETWTSSTYYIKDIISDCSKFYIKINDDIYGKLKIIIKLRDSKNKVIIFSPYFIEIINKKNIESTIKSEEEKERREEKITNFSKISIKNIANNTIILNSKAFNTNNNSKKLYNAYIKYSFMLFGIIITILYIIKPKEKENEFK